MISIDTVYQKVLAFANKEQRGYITPQEFNLFADHAQKEIFEQYFYDLNQFLRVPNNSEEYSDIIHNINEKISFFETTGTINNGVLSEGNIYRLGTIIANGTIIVEEVQQDDILEMNMSYLTKPTIDRPVYVRTGKNTIQHYPINLPNGQPWGWTGTYTYIRKPLKPNWSYVVVNGKAMWNPSNKVDFELHPSEETELTYKILKSAGLAMRRDDIARGGQALESLQVQQEKQ
tara:strand:- start:222 stop:917 length:696 start_codon:yes stop_codon:yes gene_type:complete